MSNGNSAGIGAAASAAPAAGEQQNAGAAAAASAGAAASDRAAASGQPGAENGGAVSPAAIYKPDGLPDHLLGGTDQETIDKIAKAYQGSRTALSGYEPPPEKPEGYEMAWSEKVTPYMTDAADDKFVGALREKALAAGLSNKQLNSFLNGAMETMLDMDLIDKPVDVQAELAKLVPADVARLPKADQDAAVQRRVSANIAYVQTLANQGVPKEAIDAVSAELAGFPELHMVIEALRAPGAQPFVGGQPPAGITQATLNERMADPRHQLGNEKYDLSFVAETTRMFKQLYPG